MKDKEISEKMKTWGFTDPDIPQVKTLLGMPEIKVVLRWLRNKEEAATAGLLRSSPSRVLQDQGKAAALKQAREHMEMAVDLIREEA